MTIPSGARLGPYEVFGPLGAGGMGEVYKARDTRLGREVAIKVIPEEFFEDKDRKERFEREARTLASLNHPNIAAIHSFEESDGRHLLVMEFLEGETLRERLEEGALAPRKAIDLAVQIANGLAAAHDKGIVHRDLKPENVFVTKEGRAKILDFGLAKLTQPEPAADLTSAPTTPAPTDTGVVMGTAGYMSPEQVRGESVDHRSDIFALGAILYEMLSGNRAFKGDTAVETMHAILKADPRELRETQPAISPALERIVRRCLEKGADERFQSVRDVGFALEALSDGSTSSAGVAAPSRERRVGRLLFLLLGAAVVSTIALAFFLVGRRTAQREPPLFHRLTWRHGRVLSARFAPDGQTVLYSASWDGKPPAIYIKRPESPDAVPLDLPSAGLLAISPSGELAIRLNRWWAHFGVDRGTLARVPLTGGAPREVAENVNQVDWGPDKNLVVARDVNGKGRLEYPLGKVLYETTGHVSYPRFSPRGDLIAFIDHPFAYDDQGSIAIVDLQGKKKTLTKDFDSVQGLAWSPSGEVWFAAAPAETGRLLWGVALSGRLRAIARVPGNVRLQDVARSGRALLTQGDERAAIKWLAPGETRERDVSWLGLSELADLSQDGKTVVFSELGEPVRPKLAVCLWRTDGSPVRLGDGAAGRISPDGKWVLSQLQKKGAPLVLLPTGPGEPKEIRFQGWTNTGLSGVDWFPDGKRLLLRLQQEGRADPSLFVWSLDEEKPRPVTLRGVGAGLISPDGRLIVARDPGQKLTLYPLDGGEPRHVPGAAEEDIPLRWSADGRSLYVQELKPQRYDPYSPMRVFRLDLKTGKRVVWKELFPEDPTGVEHAGFARLTPDGSSYAYGYHRLLSDLYLVEGLK